MNSKTVSPFRVTFRREGTMINAYLSPPPGAPVSQMDWLLLGSIRIACCDAGGGPSGAVFMAFRAAIQEGVTAMSKELFGQAPTFEEQPAPPGERGGNA